MTVFDILVQYRVGLLDGLSVTLKLCAIIWFLGIVLGTGVGAAGAKWKMAVGIPTRTASFLLSGIPILVFLFWMHYPLQAMLHVVIDPFYTAAATLTIVNTFAVADLVRSVLDDFPAEYVIAARVCGLPWHQTFLHIQLPLLLRRIMPNLLTIQVNILQATLFASLISVEELFRVAQRINSEVYRPIEVYSTLAVFFLAICLPLNGLALWLRSRYTRNMSEQ